MVVLIRDGKRAFVCNAKSETVAVIELASGQLRLIKVPGRPESAILSRDGSKLYVANIDADNITIIDTARRRLSTESPPARGARYGWRSLRMNACWCMRSCTPAVRSSSTWRRARS